MFRISSAATTLILVGTLEMIYLFASFEFEMELRLELEFVSAALRELISCDRMVLFFSNSEIR